MNALEAELFLKEQEATLKEGQTRAGLICPFCGGGRHNERSFSCSKLNGVVRYYCHRSSCSKGGYFSSKAHRSKDYSAQPDSGYDGKGSAGIHRDEARANHITVETSELPEEVRKALSTRYHLSRAEIDSAKLRYIPPRTIAGREWGGRVWIPIHDFYGIPRGGVAYSLEKEPPKAILQSSDKYPLSWYRFQKETPELSPGLLVIVEDQFSAIRAAPYCFAGVAIHGTNFNLERALTLKSHCPSNIKLVLALDKDAYAKSLVLARRYSAIVDLQVVRLPRDLKDFDRKSLKDFIIRLNTGD